MERKETITPESTTEQGTMDQNAATESGEEPTQSMQAPEQK